MIGFSLTKKGRACYTECLALPFFYVSFWLFLAVFFTQPALVVPAQTALPQIPRLDSQDMVFRQYLADVEAARRFIFSPRQRAPDGVNQEAGALLTIYSYLILEEDDLIRIAARSNIPIATLASLNRLSNAEDLRAGGVLLLPSMPGIFVPEYPASELERLISTARAEDNLGLLLHIPREGRNERFMFIPGDDFSPTERTFFLNRGFQFPLRDFRLTSSFGHRVNPVTGRAGMHRGIDLAAPAGTEVFAVRNGTVIDIGFDPTLGNYILIEHDSNWISLYGHLSSINTGLNTRVQSGTFIGRVGSTGQSTGPHLHFELMRNGQNHDPARLLRLFPGVQEH